MSTNQPTLGPREGEPWTNEHPCRRVNLKPRRQIERIEAEKDRIVGQIEDSIVKEPRTKVEKLEKANSRLCYWEQFWRLHAEEAWNAQKELHATVKELRWATEDHSGPIDIKFNAGTLEAETVSGYFVQYPKEKPPEAVNETGPPAD